MPQAATLPTPSHTPRRPRNTRETVRHAHAHNTPRAASIEERTAVLETRWEETVPTLPTQADMRGLVLWIVGAAFTLALGAGGLWVSSNARIDQVNARLDTRMDSLEAKIESRIDKLDSRIDKLDSRIDKLDSRIDKLAAKLDALATQQAGLDARLDALMAELVRQRRGE